MKDVPTPISKKIVGILFFMTFADGLSLNFYNTIGALMMSYQFGIESEDVGYYIGYLASAYYVGQLLCNFPLSFISDRIGRKPVILFGLTFNIICQLAFGLSKWFWLAVLVRFINGLTNAGLPLTKCFVREVSDISNQARMFSFRSIGLAIGALVAPLIGSAFSRPADSKLADIAPLFGADFLVTFPYFLVCSIVCVVDTICLIVLILFLPETLPSKSQLKKEIIPLEIEMDEIENIEDNGKKIEEKEEIIDDIVLYVDENTTKYSDEEPLVETQIEMDENERIEEESNVIKKKIAIFLESSKRQLSYVDRGVLVSITLYVILSFIVNITAQIIPIWATRDVSEDGLSFEEKQLGIMYSLGSISALLFQVFLFSRLDKKLGSNNSFRAAISLYNCFLDSISINIIFSFLHACNFSHSLFIIYC